MASRQKLGGASIEVGHEQHQPLGAYEFLASRIETACLILLAGLLFWKGIIPAWQTLNTDFPNYYLAARLLREGYSLDRIYDWIWLQRIKDHWGVNQPLVGFAGLTPFSALPILPLAGFSVMLAKHLWICANIFFLYGTTEIFHRVTSLGRRRIWVLCLLAAIPLRTSFQLGQMHLLVLLFVALGWFFFLKNKRVACGICLGVAGALKIYPFLFVIYFLWKRRWREALSILTFAAVLLVIGYASMGSSVMHTYITQVLPRSLQGEVIDPYNVYAASGAAFLHRLLIFEPELNPAPVYNSPGLYAVFYPLWQVVILLPLFACFRPSVVKQEIERVEWAAFVFALLLLSPVPASYHFVVLILSMVLFIDVLVRRREYRLVAVAITLYFLTCTIGLLPFRVGEKFSLLTFLAFARLWIGMLLWLLFVSYLWRERKQFTEFSIQRLHAAQLVLAFTILWVLGFTGYQRHFAYFKEDMSRRMHLPMSSLLETQVHATPGGFLYTAMTRDAYRLRNQDGREVWGKTPNRSQVDELTSASAVDQPFGFVELADGGGSHLVAFPVVGQSLGSSPFSPRDLGLSGVEAPALSPDGSSVAFIREESRGQNSLWFANLQYGSDRVTVKNESEIAASSYDVRDVAFAGSGALLFTAKIHGKTEIFRVTPGHTPTVFIAKQEDVDSPAISPDQASIVFRRLLHNRWQLVLADSAGTGGRYLTSGDCNAYAPTWMSQTTIAYATDCGRGFGLTALASVQADR